MRVVEKQEMKRNCQMWHNRKHIINTMQCIPFYFGIKIQLKLSKFYVILGYLLQPDLHTFQFFKFFFDNLMFDQQFLMISFLQVKCLERIKKK